MALSEPSEEACVVGEAVVSQHAASLIDPNAQQWGCTRLWRCRRERSQTQPGVFLKCCYGIRLSFSRINLPSFPRDSSSFWIWFSRKNMATANASSARSCNLGGIMTLSSPIKSSREGVWSLHAQRGGHTKNTHTATTVITKRLSVCAWPSLPVCVWTSPDVQILLCEVFTFGWVFLLIKCQQWSGKNPRNVHQRADFRLRGVTLGAEVADAVVCVPHVALYCPIHNVHRRTTGGLLLPLRPLDVPKVHHRAKAYYSLTSAVCSTRIGQCRTDGAALRQQVSHFSLEPQ